jgi:hypothetical protein
MDLIIIHVHESWGVFGWLQADTVAAVWSAAAAIHREKNTVEAAAAAGLQPQQAAAYKLLVLTQPAATMPSAAESMQSCISVDLRAWSSQSWRSRDR